MDPHGMIEGGGHSELKAGACVGRDRRPYRRDIADERGHAMVQIIVLACNADVDKLREEVVKREKNTDRTAALDPARELHRSIDGNLDVGTRGDHLDVEGARKVEYLTVGLQGFTTFGRNSTRLVQGSEGAKCKPARKEA